MKDAKTETAAGLLKAAILQRLVAVDLLDDRTLASVKIGIEAFNSGDEDMCRKLLVKMRDKNIGIDMNLLDVKAMLIIKRIRKFLRKCEAADFMRENFFIDTLAQEVADRDATPSAGQPAGEGE